MKQFHWLCSLINHIQVHYDHQPLTQRNDLFKENATSVQQIKRGFIKDNCFKNIASNLFYMHELHGHAINVTQIVSVDNHADLFTKLLPPIVHHHHYHGIGF